MEKSSGKHVVGHIIFDGLEVSFELSHFVRVFSHGRAVVKFEFVQLIQ